MEEHDSLKEQILKLVARNEIDQIFELLAKRQFSKLDKELILLNNRYNKIKEESRMDVISKEEANRELNRITLALVELATEVDKGAAQISNTTISQNKSLYYLLPLAMLLIGAAIFMYAQSGTTDEASSEEREAATESNDAVEDNLWNLALAENDIKNFSTYVTLFPEGKYIEEAHRRIRELGDEPFWKERLRDNTRASYQAYLEEFPNGKFQARAKDSIRLIDERLAAIQLDNQSFDRAARTNTIASYQGYIDRYPEGQHVGIARANIKALQAEQTCSCPARTFRTRSEHSWAEFRMPASKQGATVSIPGGAYNKYVFPKCNRVWWSDLVFSCNPSTCKWERISGRWDADALCHGGYTDHRYLFVGTR